MKIKSLADAIETQKKIRVELSFKERLLKTLKDELRASNGKGKELEKRIEKLKDEIAGLQAVLDGLKAGIESHRKEETMLGGLLSFGNERERIQPSRQTERERLADKIKQAYLGFVDMIQDSSWLEYYLNEVELEQYLKDLEEQLSKASRMPLDPESGVKELLDYLTKEFGSKKEIKAKLLEQIWPIWSRKKKSNVGRIYHELLNNETISKLALAYFLLENERDLFKTIKKALKGEQTLSQEAKARMIQEIKAEIKQVQAKLEELKSYPGRIVVHGNGRGALVIGRKIDRWTRFVSNWKQLAQEFNQPVDPLGRKARGIWKEGFEALGFMAKGSNSPLTEDELRRYGAGRLLQTKEVSQ